LALAASFPIQRAQGNLFNNLFGKTGQETARITPNEDFYVTTYDTIPEISVDSWALKIHGLVTRPLTLTYEDLLNKPQTSLIATLECIGNPVGGYSIGTAQWEGVRVQELLDEAGVESNAFDLVLHGADDYSDSFPISRAMQKEVILATKMNGVPLPLEHGFPARIIVPGIVGMKHVKWLTSLEPVSYDYKGYWQQQSWPDDAPNTLSSRIDLPGDRETITEKTYRIKGIAFGGQETIRRVEISTDGGAQWKPAILEPPPSPYAWTPWFYDWPLPQKGEYILVVRAIGQSGRVQATQFGGRAPQGTVDLHSISVEIRSS
jgi:DMSO/TMAO reductase YedYZ molybdopterin-dependent catalytic subunit